MTQGPEKPEENDLTPAPEDAPEAATPEAEHPGDGTTEPEAAPVARGEATPSSRKSSAREWLETIIIALVVALLIRTFVVQVYVVDGESMEPTLHTGERFLVNKFIYRFRTPQPGEVVVLNDPGRPTRELIKRVVAVAGETVEVKQGVTYVNGQAVKEPFVNRLYPISDTPAFKVPAGTIYVMGDNRGRSFDSRSIGPILLSKVEGEAFFMLWPVDRFAGVSFYTPRVKEAAASK